MWKSMSINRPRAPGRRQAEGVQRLHLRCRSATLDACSTQSKNGWKKLVANISAYGFILVPMEVIHANEEIGLPSHGLRPDAVGTSFRIAF
jgi:hypothetical protein